MKIAELFDELLDLTAAYPRTFILLLLAPKRVFGAEREHSRCPPSAFVALTFIGLYFLIQATPTTPTVSLKLPDWIKPEYALALAFAGIATLANVQGAALDFCFHELRPSSKASIGALCYPYCLIVALTCALILSHHGSVVLYTIQPLYFWLLFTVTRFSYRMSIPRAAMAATVAHLCFIGLGVALTLATL